MKTLENFTFDKNLLEICEHFLADKGTLIEARSTSSSSIDRLEISLPNHFFEQPLRANLGNVQLPGYYFHLPEKGETHFGLGVVTRVEGPISESCTRANRILRDSAPGIHAFGGGRFDEIMPENSTPSTWEKFGVGCFLIPRLYILRGPEKCVASFQFTKKEDRKEQFEKFTKRLRDEVTWSLYIGDEPRPTHQPDSAAWDALVAAALKSICSKENALEKIVLARETIFSQPGKKALPDVLESFWQTNSSCFHFAFRPRTAAPLFVAATPELLFVREQSRLRSEAIAGTCPRGNNPGENATLAAKMLASDKERREHASVIESIRRNLTPLLTNAPEEEGPDVLRLSHLQHLRTKLSGRLRPEIDDAQILRALHPTPATNGSPREAAMTWIREHEGWDRGWYAGPMGLLSLDESIFTVAIRSGLFDKDTARIFAGAGIVRGSESDAEWQEVESKAAGFLKHFDL
ncbi:MAG: isochorismate synthase MenF [Chthoniobacterales bacterium]